MSGFQVSLNLYETLGLSVIVLLLGMLLVAKIPILTRFCIPAPVVGGIVFALLALLGHSTGMFSIEMDMGLKDFFMICFFTTVGFGANFEVLKKGGVGVIIFLGIASLLCIVQNLVGSGLATVMGQNPLLGIAAGSVPLTGGHGTAGTFGPLLEQAGLQAGATIAIASATFGLVSGSLMGGPLAAGLIKKRTLTSLGDVNAPKVEDVVDEKAVLLNSEHISMGFFQLLIAVGLGSVVSDLIALTGFPVPRYIGSMIIAIIMTNIFSRKSKHPMRVKEIQALGDAFLAVFLAQALMSLKLWELADLAGPLAVILLVQAVVMWTFARYITFNVMGKDYDAAVLSSGHCGFGMGATPNAVANMNAVTKKFGPSPKAFFILPIVGGMFIDVTNSLIITFFINWLK